MSSCWVDYEEWRALRAWYKGEYYFKPLNPAKIVLLLNQK